MKIINIGVLAHVDAGKTTLTESLLYNSGAITELGSVDKGTTRTDNTLLERQRGITIQTGITDVYKRQFHDRGSISQILCDSCGFHMVYVYKNF